MILPTVSPRVLRPVQGGAESTTDHLPIGPHRCHGDGPARQAVPLPSAVADAAAGHLQHWARPAAPKAQSAEPYCRELPRGGPEAG
eukprot:12501297-Alexandrium_andersonii.AAC.1